MKKGDPEVKRETATVLLVDDDLEQSKFAKEILERYYHVLWIVSKKDVIQYCEQYMPDLVLIGVYEAEKDGFEVLRQIKKNLRNTEIPIAFLTVGDDIDNEIKGLREGVSEFIRKPFVEEILLHRIRRILELDKLQKKLEREVSRKTYEAEQRRQKVERLSMQIMFTLAETIDAKNKYTNGHSFRVAKYASEIAKRAGKSRQEQEDIYYIGLLHDIGKIGIPNKIIDKASGLTEEEYAVMKDHPNIGAEILGTMTEIPGLAVGAHWHHELFDGTGYPDGLKGEEIPEVARIIGVSDAYDAMTSKRSYRDVMPQEDVKRELRNGSGTQFDPRYVEIMLQMMEEDTEYRLCARDTFMR